MAKAAWNRTIVDAAGNVLPGADITVTDERTGTLATLFDDREGNDAKSNPFVADSNGFARFFAEPGVYRVVAESGALSRTWRFQSLLDNALDITWTGEQTFTDTVKIDDDLEVTGDVEIGGNAEIDGDLEIGGAIVGPLNGPGDMINGAFVGDLFQRFGNAVAPSAGHPRFCLSNFAGSVALDAADWPDLVPYLRAQKVTYLEGQSGAASTFAGSASGSVITLTNVAANNALLVALAEFQLDFGTFTDFLTVDWEGTTFAITAINAVTRTITVTGTPTAGSGNAEIYPHRIAGSTTTARLHSARGKDIRAAGTAEYLNGLMWRDQMQRIEGTIRSNRFARNFAVDSTGALSGELGYGNDGSAFDSTVNGLRLKFDSQYTGQRTGTTTRGTGLGVNFYIHGGRYSG